METGRSVQATVQVPPAIRERGVRVTFIRCASLSAFEAKRMNRMNTHFDPDRLFGELHFGGKIASLLMEYKTSGISRKTNPRYKADEIMRKM